MHAAVYIFALVYLPHSNQLASSYSTLHSALGNLCTRPHARPGRRVRGPGPGVISQHPAISFWPGALPGVQPGGRGEISLPFITKLGALSWNSFSCLFHSSRVQIARREVFSRPRDSHFQEGVREFRASCSFVLPGTNGLLSGRADCRNSPGTGIIRILYGAEQSGTKTSQASQATCRSSGGLRERHTG